MMIKHSSPYKIKHSSPYIGREEISGVIEILKRGEISTQRYVEIFEKKLENFLGVKGVALSSGTASLYLILKEMKEKKKSKTEVIIPSFTCSAILNAVWWNGLKPVFVDIEDDFCISFDDFKRKINRKTLCVVFVHSFGYVRDIRDFLIVDAVEGIAQAFGGEINGKKVGTYAEYSFSSFYATKIITTGEGGAIFSKDKKFIEKIKDFINYDKKEWIPRFNFKISDLGAVLGIKQLEKIELMLKKRKELAKEYFRLLSGFPIKLPPRNGVFWRFVVTFEKKVDVDKVIMEMRRDGIEVSKPIWKPLHTFFGLRLPKTEHIFQNSISLPIHPNMRKEDVRSVVQRLSYFF